MTYPYYEELDLMFASDATTEPKVAVGDSAAERMASTQQTSDCSSDPSHAIGSNQEDSQEFYDMTDVDNPQEPPVESHPETAVEENSVSTLPDIAVERSCGGDFYREEPCFTRKLKLIMTFKYSSEPKEAYIR
ncbi:unnamed protein product [Eretmochelys imbricata]